MNFIYNFGDFTIEEQDLIEKYVNDLYDHIGRAKPHKAECCKRDGYIQVAAEQGNSFLLEYQEPYLNELKHVNYLYDSTFNYEIPFSKTDISISYGGPVIFLWFEPCWWVLYLKSGVPMKETVGIRESLLSVKSFEDLREADIYSTKEDLCS